MRKRRDYTAGGEKDANCRQRGGYMLKKLRNVGIGLLCVAAIVVLIVVLGGGSQNFRSKYEGVDLTTDVTGLGRSDTYDGYLRDHADAVNKENELLETGLVILDRASPHAVGLQGQRYEVLRRSGSHLFRGGTVKADPYLPVCHHPVTDVGVTVFSAIDHIGDQLAVEAYGSGIKRLIGQEVLRNIHSRSSTSSL